MRRLMLMAALAAIALPAAAAPAKKAAAEGPGYGVDLISVATPSRHASLATADCLVWANAEGLGVGPAQLGGLHGLAMHINVAPMPGDTGTATPFTEGIAGLKRDVPTAPAWLLAALEKSRPAIEAACAQDHPTPVKVRAITVADRGK